MSTPRRARLAGAYDALINALAVLGGAILLAILASSLVGIALRGVGRSSLQAAIGFNDYSLLYFTMLVAPYLVRHHGHVRVDSFARMLSGDAQRVLEKIVLVICVLISLTFVWYSIELTVEAYRRGTMSVTSVTIPSWVTYAALPVGFALMSIEYGRFLFGFAPFDDTRRPLDGH